MSKAVTISSKGQVTLPKELREKYHLNEGETAVLLDSGEGILIKHGRTSLKGLHNVLICLTAAKDGSLDINGNPRLMASPALP